jgi:hypothetical protein
MREAESRYLPRMRIESDQFGVQLERLGCEPDIVGRDRFTGSLKDRGDSAEVVRRRFRKVGDIHKWVSEKLVEFREILSGFRAAVESVEEFAQHDDGYRESVRFSDELRDPGIPTLQRDVGIRVEEPPHFQKS